MKLSYRKEFNKIKGVLFAKDNLQWEKVVMPLGNGTLGVSIYGGINTERIIVNDKTLWSGGPSPKRPNYNGGNLEVGKNHKTSKENFKKVRELFKEGKNQEAALLCEELVGLEEGYGSYLCMGEIQISHLDKVINKKNYSRVLDLDTAVCSIEYKNGKNNQEFERKYFVSHPNKVAVLKFSSNLPFNISLMYKINRESNYESNGSRVVYYGVVEDNLMQFASAINLQTDGKVVFDGTKYTISNAKVVVCTLGTITDYLDNYPTYRDGKNLLELKQIVASRVDSAQEIGFETLLTNHILDYQNLYKRVDLDLNGDTDISTDKLLRKYSRKTATMSEKRYLEMLLYQYGRYLTIASSREDDLLPSNLQGIWNNCDNPKWSSDFHLNVNLQMNYWQVYSSNLLECAKPLIRYIEALKKPGRITAAIYTGSLYEDKEANGFMFHTQNTPFGWTCPGWDFSWGWSPAAVSWILHNVYEYYEYSLDKNLLKHIIYPMLKESSKYTLSLLIDNGTRLVSSPCFSPEHGPRTQGNTYEQSLNYQLFQDTLNAARALEVDIALQLELQKAIKKMKPIEIGVDGQIKEWYHENRLGEIGQTKHRHLSHLLGLYPCSVIDKFKNPEYIKAAIVSLNKRGDKSTGWAKAQRINTWARIGDGDRALKLIYDLISQSINPNLFDVHPPFQIDGNFGYTAGVNEMLVQSNLGIIELLPALPKEWERGHIKGIVTRGNFLLDLQWGKSKLISCKVFSNKGGECKIKYKDFALEASQEYILKNGYVIIPTKTGDSFDITIKKEKI